jgi:putative ATP-binding cassette transporter
LLLLSHIHETFLPGESYLLEGASGIGKSTFIRTIAGIWPYANGEIILPAAAKIMYLPQRPYMPIGTLIEAIYFPNKVEGISKRDVAPILQDARLENLIDRLHDTASWSTQLSPGEQQRITLARILLEKPDWIFLDESTSQLDIENETYFYELLQARLPNAALISVGHRPTLQQFHHHRINMQKYLPADTSYSFVF